jgi:uncharacterized protein YjbI with pentapeptide repeats
MAGADLRRASLAGATFLGTDLLDTLGIDGLRGAQLDRHQVVSLAVRLARELGIVVLDD